MAVTWRFRRVFVASVLIWTCLVIYLAAAMLKPSTYLTTTSYKPPTVERSKRTFINRPLDLTSPEGRRSRMERVENVCLTRSPKGDTMNILVYPRGSALGDVSYCVVPKAGCTFWIRIFRFLNNDTGGVAVRTPFDIDRMLAHDKRRRTMKMYHLQKPEEKLFIVNTTRFMFARDPYSRVWSAYLDKLFLPNLWASVGREIIKRRPSPSSQSLLCGNDVTFQEFVQYVVQQSETNGPGHLNGHWRPIQYVRDPCQFRPDFIGKQETFMTDTEFILDHMGQKRLLQGYDRVAHLHDEISILIDFNFQMLDVLPAQCASPIRLAQLLWTAFQLNGHVTASGSDSELNAAKEMNEDDFKRLVFSGLVSHWEEILSTAQARRRQALVDAYRSLPRDLLDKFVALYKWDFKYFGYEKKPRDIFL